MTTNEDRLEQIETALTRLPIVGEIFAAGSSDPMYDLMMVAGPLLVILVRLVGRTLLTEGLVFLYLLSFVAYLLYRSARR
jgi:hypothetical protein